MLLDGALSAGRRWQSYYSELAWPDV